MEEARKAAEVAKQKEEGEKKRIQEQIKARRAAAKERLAKASTATQANTEALPSMFAACAKKPASTGGAAAVDYEDVKTFYSVSELQAQSVPGLDYKNREKYLSDEDFQSVFSCGKAEFAGLPKWKQTKMKRTAKLF